MNVHTRLVQLRNGKERRVGVVREPHIELTDQESVYDLACAALQGGGGGGSLYDLIDSARKGILLSYDEIHAGAAEWKLLPALDHPRETARCLVTGTGLTHLGSAKNRDAMHEQLDENSLTDSMKMFRWGVAEGKPEKGQAGVAPEWFYKGTGAELRAHNQALEVPAFGEDGGEEAEVAGLYIIDALGRPVRVGMAQGNEFSDHVFEKRNYLNLAGSKLRTCSIGPEIVIDADFSTVPGKVSIVRAGKEMWSKEIATGETEMCHSLANIEHHHFKFAAHRRPGDVHIHFYGACALSFGEGVKLQHDDMMQVQFQNFGRPLRNPLRLAQEKDRLISVLPIR